LIGEPADFGKGVLDALAHGRLVYQSDAGRLMAPFITDVYADVIALRQIPPESCGNLL
jgi:hypothetical protein